MNTNKFSLRIACSTAALMCAAHMAPAWAQGQADPAADAQIVATDGQEDTAANKDEIVVTGTNISGVKPVGNTAIVLTREDAEKAGYSTPAELLRTLPQQRASEYETDAGSGTISLQNAGGANTIDLRGFGSSGGRSSTLLLIDGRRTVGFGTNLAGTEANQVPLAAIERIEVIADGASAVYGTDAVAGVVNYILRKDYNGGEVSLRGNNNAGGFEYGLDATLGTTWETGLGKGNILVAYGYTHRDAYLAGKNEFLRYDARPVGGIDRRLSGGAAFSYLPNIVVDRGSGYFNTTIPAAGQADYYGVPAGANVGLTAAQLRPQNPNLDDPAFTRDYTGKLQRHQVAFFVNQEIGESVEVFVQGNYLNRETTTRRPVGNGLNSGVLLRRFLRDASGAVTATPNPYYVSGVPNVAPGADLTVLYPILKDIQPVSFGSDESYNVTGGVRVKLPGGWKGEAYYTYGRNKGCGYCYTQGYVNPVALQYQVDIGAINPLSNVPLTPAQVASFTGSQLQIGHNGIDDAVVRFNGPLFDLPGGTVRAAFGGERLKTFNWNENTSVGGANNAPTVLTDRANSFYGRTVKSAFGELYLPLVGEEMNVPFVKSLVASAAVRYDNYSDVGHTTNPKFGLTWEVGDFLSLSGSWGTSYVAPTLTDRNPGAYVSGVVFPLWLQPLGANDPRLPATCLPALFLPPNGGCILSGVAWLLGSDPAMQPQTAKQWSLGATLTPGGGFRVNVNYYNIDYRNKIVFPATLGEFSRGIVPGSNPPSYRGYESRIIDINNPVTCNNSNLATADPALQAILSRPIYNAGSGVGSLAAFPNFCGITVVVDNRFTNLARSKTDGLDIDVSWTGSLGEVTLNANASANVILNNNEVVVAGAPTIERLNTLGDPPNPLKWRGRAGVGAAYRGFNATLFGNYFGSIINDQNQIAPGLPGPVVKIPAYTTFDLNLGYSTDFKGRQAGFLKGLRGSITVLNLFDRDPQIVVNKNGAILEGRGSPFGRTVSFQLTGSF